MKKFLLAASIALLPTLVCAQSSPNLTKGQVPTAGQWNSYFAGKQDVLGYTPMSAAGGVFTGRLVTAPSGATVAGFNLTPGPAPAGPVNGDIWATSAGMFIHVNGVTSPISVASSGSFAATAPLSVSFPSSITTYACPTCATTTNGGALSATSPITLSAGGAIGISGAAFTVIPTQPPYNAKCDNTTDDAAALQAAFNAAAGGELHVPAGYFCATSAVLTFPADSTKVTGAGAGVSGFKSLISNRGAIFYAANRQNIEVSNLSLTGTRTVTSWTLPSFGAIDIEQDSSAAAAKDGFFFRNLKLSGFNPTYWMQLSLGNSTFDMTGVLVENVQFDTVSADIPTDPTPSFNVNYAIAAYGGSNGAKIRGTIRNLTVNGTGICFGIGLYNTHTGFNVHGNALLNVGATNTVAHCTNGLGFTNSYGIFVYDNSSTGFPSNKGLIQNNYITNPYSNGIYMVGAQNATLAYNDFNTIVSGNLIDGQSQSDLPIRCAIAVNNLTNALVTGNKLNNNWCGVATSGQYIGQVDVKGNQITSNVAGGSCWSIAGASGTTGNVPEHNFQNNTCETTGASSQTVKVTSDSSHYLGSINFTDNRVVSSVLGANFSGAFLNGRIVARGNTFSGASSTSNLDVSNLTGGYAVLQNNVIDLAGNTTGIGLKTTSSLVYNSGTLFLNRNSGSAFAFSGVGTTGTLSGMAFSNVATANQAVASSIGLTLPSWSAASQDYVQNIAASVAGNFLTVGWLNTSNGVNWQPLNITNGLSIASLSDYYAATSSKLLVASAVYPTETTTTFGATTTFDFNTFINTAVTLTGNITTMTLSNVRAGKSGTMRFIQDGTGSRTTVWNSIFKFSGGTTPTLSTAANAIDVLSYTCVTASNCPAVLTKDVR